MTNKKITFAATDGVDKYDSEIQDFMEKIFGIKDYFVTDESTLSDFAMCCIPKDFSVEVPYETLVTSCQEIMVHKILDQYDLGVDPYNTILRTVKIITALK